MNPQPKRLPNIVFDFGGVLMDWNPRYLYSRYFDGDSHAMEDFLAEIHFSEWNTEQDRGRPFAEGVALLTAQYPQHAELILAFDEHWEETVGGAILPVVDMAQRLKAAGYRLHGLSNWSEEKFRQVRQKFAFFNLFDSILVSGEVKLAKPDPRIYQVFLQRIGQPGTDCLFIDDSAANIAAARKLGFGTILFESEDQLEQELAVRGLLDTH